MVNKMEMLNENSRFGRHNYQHSINIFIIITLAILIYIYQLTKTKVQPIAFIKKYLKNKNKNISNYQTR